MRLWGKVVSRVLLVMAAVFAAVAIVIPGAWREALGAVILLIVVAFFGVPVVIRFFMSYTGDEEVLANGVAGAATITSLKPTGWRYNRYYPIVRFSLSAKVGSAAYPTRKTTPTLVGVILLVLSFFFTVLSFEERNYEKEGLIVKGRLIGRSGKGEWAYKFTTRGGQILDGTSEVLSDTSSKLKDGDIRGAASHSLMPASAACSALSAQQGEHVTSP